MACLADDRLARWNIFLEYLNRHPPAFPKAAKQIAEIEAELEAAEVCGLGFGIGDLVLLGSLRVALHSWGWG